MSSRLVLNIATCCEIHYVRNSITGSINAKATAVRVIATFRDALSVDVQFRIDDGSISCRAETSSTRISLFLFRLYLNQFESTAFINFRYYANTVTQPVLKISKSSQRNKKGRNGYK